jgi:hypothetical protein
MGLAKRWLEMAKERTAFLFATPDQLPISYLIKYMKLDAHIISTHTRPEMFVNNPEYSHLR